MKKHSPPHSPTAASQSLPPYCFPPSLAPFPFINAYGPEHEHEHDQENDEDDEEDLFDWNAFFTVAQDLLLVKYRCFQPELAMNDIVLRFQRELNVARSVQELEERFQKLQAPEFRALFVLYLRATALARDPNHYSHANVLPAYLPLLQSTRSSCETRLFQLIYEDEKLQQEAVELLNVEISSRHFPKYTRSVSKAQLRRCCRAIDALFHQADHEDADVVTSPHQSFTLHAARAGSLERLHLTDAVSHYDYFMVYNHLEQPIFDRLVLFAKDLNIMERLALLQQQQIETEQLRKESVHQLHGIFETQKTRQVAEIQDKRRQEIGQMKHRLEQTLEEDLAYVRKLHDQLVRHEKAKIDAKYDQQVAILNERIEEMKSHVFALHKSCENGGWHGIERDIAQTSLQVEKIFGTSDYLLRLLILAEDLDADPLRKALVRYLSKDAMFPQFALRREFTSKMISETTILSILQAISTADLREIEGFGKQFVFHELAARELHTRKVSFGRYLASLTNDKLRVALQLKNKATDAPTTTKKPHDHATNETPLEEYYGGDFEAHIAAVRDFPEILDTEFARRREFSCVKMNSANMETEVSFSEEDCVLQLEASYRYCTVFATKERKQGESGKWMFEVTIHEFEGDGESLLIGWEVPRHHADGHNNATLVPGLAACSDGKGYGVTWQSDGGLDMGMLHANGQSKSGVACFRAGDVIGCTINQDDSSPHVRFYLNGVLVLPSSSMTSTNGAKQSNGIAVHNPAYCLFPVVSMYSSKKKPLMKVRFNFRGDFRFPISGFEPYGAPL